jgi:hypothetical protein
LEAENTPDDAVLTNKEAIVTYLDPGRTKQTYGLFATNPMGIRADARGTPGSAIRANGNSPRRSPCSSTARVPASDLLPLAHG